MKHVHRWKGINLRALCAIALAAGLCLSLAPQAAWASGGVTESIVESWQNASSASPFAYAESSDGIMSLSEDDDSSQLPSKFNLRDVTQADIDAGYTSITKAGNYVTSVKLQNPWATCWGFAAIAASETSILAELGETYDELALDLSERQLVYFSGKALPDDEETQEDYNNQGGEGRHSTSASTNPNYMFTAGQVNYATTVFSSGAGPLVEELAPYKNDEDIITYILHKDGEQDQTKSLTAEEAAEYKEQGYTVTKYQYADTYTDAEGNTTPTTWSLDEDLRFGSSYELESGNILPDIRNTDENSSYVSTNEDAIAAIKEELLAGRAVSVSYYADQSLPGQVTQGTYINLDTWAQYTYDDVTPTHGVTIVGYDDSYSASNFLEGHQPPADGAFIVKNSWGAGGSSDETFSNGGDWGIDEDGDGTGDGYFYLSYYDKTLRLAESFDFDLSPYTQIDEYLIDQYNYLVSNSRYYSTFDTEAPEANVFEADVDMTVRTLTCETTRPNTQVTYRLYVLGDDASDPTDGTLAYEAKETYDYGGYHRLTIPEESWVALREGQRYSVVVTQLCLDDNKYYQSVAKQEVKASESDVEKLREQYTESYTTQYYQAALAAYLGIGKTQEEAEELAKAYVERESVQEEIKALAEKAVSAVADIYYVGVVNEGESYTYVPGAGWGDWSGVVAWLDETYVYDNFPLKAIGDIQDYASVDELTGLADAIAAAKEALAGAVVSADGTDVDAGSKWVTQDEYDALAAAIAAAEETLALAGDDYANTLVASTPDSDTVTAATTALTQASDTYTAAEEDGTKTDDAGGDDDSGDDSGDDGSGDTGADDGDTSDDGDDDNASIDKTSGNATSNAQKTTADDSANGSVAQTGDEALVTALAAAAFAGAALAMLSLAIRRRDAA